jgi:hypothetical protein
MRAGWFPVIEGCLPQERKTRHTGTRHKRGFANSESGHAKRLGLRARLASARFSRTPTADSSTSV